MTTDKFGRELTTIGNMTYRVASTGGSSAKYGNCEICHAPASEMFLQVRLEAAGGMPAQIYRSCTFGHKPCLESRQK